MELTHFFRHYRFSKTGYCHPPTGSLRPVGVRIKFGMMQNGLK